MYDCVTDEFLQAFISIQTKTIYLSNRDFEELRTFGRPNFDPNTYNSVPTLNIMGTLFGVEIRVLRNLIPGQILVENSGQVKQICLHCRTEFGDTSCSSNICVIRQIIEQ